MDLVSPWSKLTTTIELWIWGFELATSDLGCLFATLAIAKVPSSDGTLGATVALFALEKCISTQRRGRRMDLVEKLPYRRTTRSLIFLAHHRDRFEAIESMVTDLIAVIPAKLAMS